MKNESSNLTNRTIVIAGGGTGGHIYPGVAIARALQRKDHSIKVYFVGAQGGLEEKIVPREGFPLHLIKIGKLHNSVGKVRQIITLIGLPLALFKCIKLLYKLKPDMILGVGGFASGPFLFVASLFGFKTAIWEPNAHPGMTNRWLSRLVDSCYVVFDQAKKHLSSKNIIKTGLPVRVEVEAISSRTSAQAMGQTTGQTIGQTIGPTMGQTRPLHILVFGGSQGARAINECMATAIEISAGLDTTQPEALSWIDQVEIVHQTGVADFEAIRSRYEDLGLLQVQVFAYLHDMPERLRWADVVICRSGASTVAELAAAGKAALFIPLPSAADDHQKKNAEALTDFGAADLLLQKDLSSQSLRFQIENFIAHPEHIAQLEQSIKGFHVPHADEQIADLLIKQLELN